MIGTTISHYAILEKLGEGGMGVVYKARDVRLNRTVALKFMPGEARLNDDDRKRFLQEAQSAALLNHPNVCTIHDIKVEGEQHFIVMEFVDGRTLRKKIYGSAGQHLDEKTAIGYAMQIGEALAEAHKHGVVHRDIKADNIMVNARNQVKVMDFGLAKLKGSMKLTRDSSTIGTLAYMAPEQVRGDEVDARSDIFSYGVLLFEMLTGRMPFRGEHDAAMMYSIMNENPEPVSKFNPGVSEELRRVIERALEKDPEDRFQHSDDLVSELRRLAKKSSRIERPVSGAETPVRDVTMPPAAGTRPGSSARIQAAPPETTPYAGPAKSKFPLLPVGGFFFAAALLAVYFLFFGNTGGKIDSLAVLPFVNAGGDQEIEYLTEGVTDYLTNKLSQMPGLRVLPSSFVAKYRRADITPQTIGKELNVGAILTGRVVERNGRLSVQTELIDVSRLSQLWGERYEKDIAGIQDLQADIVSKVSGRLGVNIGSEESANLVRGSTKNTGAYQLYLKGRYQWNKRNPEAIRAALAFFQKAIDTDPSFALAYVGLAQTYVFPESEKNPSMVRAQKMRSAAEKALQIEEKLAEAHSTLASYYQYYELDMEAAEKEHRRAHELDPSYPTGLHWYAEFLCFTGRFDEGLEMYRKAVAADPLSLAIATDFGYGYYLAREYDSAAAYLENILKSDPEYVRTRAYLSTIYLAKGDTAKSYRIHRDALSVSGAGQEQLRLFDEAWRKDGLRGLARNYLTEVLAEAGNVTLPAMAIVRAYIRLGMKDSALIWVRRAQQERDPLFFGVSVESAYDPLRNEPGFHAIIREIGMEEAEKRALARQPH